MDVNDENFSFPEKFPDIDINKSQNDPWTVLSDERNSNKLIDIQTDPLRNQISSEKYLESLEKKLSRLKGKTDKQAKPSEMISSLQRTKEDQLNHILTGQNQLNDFEDELDFQEKTVISSIQRRLNPEGQAMNPVELYPLLNNDFLAKEAGTADDDSHNDDDATNKSKDTAKSP